MKKLLFITNIPSFYKVNLYDAISEKADVGVIFLNSDRIVRNQDFYRTPTNCQSFFLKKPKIFTFLSALWQLRNSDEVVLGGWDRFYYWMVLALPFRKIALVLESSIFETNTDSALKNFLKRCFLARVSRVYASGLPHIELMNRLKFDGQLIKTNGVGLIAYPKLRRVHFSSEPRKFLFVGRLEKIKGLHYLMEAFGEIQDATLSVVGEGSMESLVYSCDHIEYLGYHSTEGLSAIYHQHDVLILPSLVEPWGLVVEEAIAHGLPVIVSEQVGCSMDLVINEQLGIVMKGNSSTAVVDAVKLIKSGNVFEELLKNVQNYDIGRKDHSQIAAYLD